MKRSYANTATKKLLLPKICNRGYLFPKLQLNVRIMKLIFSYSYLEMGVNESERLGLARVTQQHRDREWKIAEKIKRSALEKIEKHEELDSCPLCERKFAQGSPLFFVS